MPDAIYPEHQKYRLKDKTRTAYFFGQKGNTNVSLPQFYKSSICAFEHQKTIKINKCFYIKKSKKVHGLFCWFNVERRSTKKALYSKE